MLLRLILLLTIVPIIELMVLLQVHHAVASQFGTGIGLLVTVGTIAFTGITGAALARHQGLSVLAKFRATAGKGTVPSDSIADGVLVLIGAVLLLTPGFLTDIFGFSLLIPWTRAGYRGYLKRWFKMNFQVVGPGSMRPPGSPDPRDPGHSSEEGGAGPHAGNPDVFYVDPLEADSTGTTGSNDSTNSDDAPPNLPSR